MFPVAAMSFFPTNSEWGPVLPHVCLLIVGFVILAILAEVKKSLGAI